MNEIVENIENLKDVERLQFFFEKECVFLSHEDASKDKRIFGINFVDLENNEIHRVQAFKDQHNRGYGISITFKEPQTLIKCKDSLVKGTFYSKEEKIANYQY